MSGLPRGWVEATFSDVSEIKLGKMLDQEKNKGKLQPYLRNVNVRWEHVDLNDILEMRFTDEEFEPFGIRDGDLLVCEGGEPGRCAVWQNGPTELKFQKALMRLRPRGGVESALLAKSLRLMTQNGELQRHFTGTTIKHLPQSALAAISVLIPPLAEQKRIVAKLDALNAKSARARTELTRIETLVSRYKQAVLSKAFWDPLSRSNTRFGHFIETAGNGLSKREGNDGEWTNVLRLTDLNQGQFAPSEPRQIRLNCKEVEKYRLAKGDLVVIRVNGSANLVGRSFCFNASDLWAFCDHFIRIRLKPTCDPHFAALFLNSPPIRSIIEHKFVSTSGQKTISQKTLEELPAPQALVEEQHEIVRRIESAFAKIDRLAGQAKRALELVGRLDEAILAKAFRGELMPQDENDEPAERLLARIRAEREKAPKVRRGRR